MTEIAEEMMFTNARIEETMYDVTFNPKTREGKIVVNLSVVDKKDLAETLDIFKQVMSCGLSVCSYVKLFNEGETFNGFTVATGKSGHRHGMQYHHRRRFSEGRHPGQAEVRRHRAGEGKTAYPFYRHDQL